MAEIIAAGFDFDNARKNAKYPYEDWFNGKVWKISRPEDFQITPKSMQINLYAAAARYDLRLRTKLEGGDSIIIQAVEWGDDE
jgi:hypothetical protein